MGCCASNPRGQLVVPIPFPEDAVSMSFFGEENVEVCIEHLHSIVTTAPERIKALRRVRTYVLEAEDEDGSNIATVTVHDPVSEIVSVYRDMLTRREARKSQARDAIDAARSAMYSAPSSNTMSVLRREHALCFMHRATLRSAGLHFTQVFNGDLLNKQLPIDLPHKALVKLLALFRRLNVDKSGAITLNQFHAWCLRLAKKGTADELASEARRDIKLSIFIPLLMLMNPTVQPWRLTAMEFVIMVHDLCCLPDRALTDAMFDCVRTAVQAYTGKRGRTGSMAIRSGGGRLPAAGGNGAVGGGHGFARFASRRMVVEDMEGSPGAAAADEDELPRDESGSHVFIASPDAAADAGAGAVLPAGEGGASPTSPDRASLVIHSRMLTETPKTRFRAFDDTDLQTITDEDETKTRDPSNEVEGDQVVEAINKVFDQLDAGAEPADAQAAHEHAATKRVSREGSGKKTVHFVPQHLGCASTSAFLAGFIAAQTTHEGSQRNLYEDLRLVSAHRGSSSRFVFTEAGLANSYLTRLQWKVLNELHSEILAPVFEMRNLVRRAALGYKFWAARQASLTARMRHRDQLIEEGLTDDGMFHLGQVGLTSENEAFLADAARDRALPANKFNIREHSVSDVDLDGMASPGGRGVGEDSKEVFGLAGQGGVDSGLDGDGNDAPGDGSDGEVDGAGGGGVDTGAGVGGRPAARRSDGEAVDAATYGSGVPAPVTGVNRDLDAGHPPGFAAAGLQEEGAPVAS